VQIIYNYMCKPRVQIIDNYMCKLDIRSMLIFAKRIEIDWRLFTYVLFYFNFDNFFKFFPSTDALNFRLKYFALKYIRVIKNV